MCLGHGKGDVVGELGWGGSRFGQELCRHVKNCGQGVRSCGDRQGKGERRVGFELRVKEFVFVA